MKVVNGEASLAAVEEAYKPDGAGPPRSYPDLHEHVVELARRGLLVVIDEPINKDTEMHPLVRWQYRGGIPEHERKAFLFTNADRQQGPQLRHAGARRRARRQPATFIASASASRSSRSARSGSTRLPRPCRPAWSTHAPCQDVVRTGDDTRQSRAPRSTACPCRSRRRAGTMRRISPQAISSPRTRTPACRISAITGDN